MSSEPARLPEFIVQQAIPFSNVAIDFAGPSYIKERKEMLTLTVDEKAFDENFRQCKIKLR